MTEHELVSAYRHGQISRRTFIRRLIGTGVSAAAALTYADALLSSAWATHVSDTSDDFYCVGSPGLNDVTVHGTLNTFDPSTLTVPQGTCVTWGWDLPSVDHSIRNNIRTLNSDFLHYYYPREFPAAGTFPYECTHPTSVHPAMKGKIKVPMQASPGSGPLGTDFTITWSSEGSLAGRPSHTAGLTDYVFDVDIKRPGGDWDPWKRGATGRQKTFEPGRRGTWRFRARLRRKSNDKHSDWSPTKSISVT